jgi:hypothetical protein
MELKSESSVSVHNVVWFPWKSDWTWIFYGCDYLLSNVDNVLYISNKPANGKIHLSQIYVKQSKKTVIEMHSGLKQKAI